MAGQYFSLPAIILFAGLFVFALFRRFRRMVGRQPLVPSWRLMLQVGLLGLVSLLFLAGALPQLSSVAAGVGGLAGGGALGFVGLRHTRFERDYYTPNTYLGLAIFTIFVARVVFQYVRVSSQLQALPAGEAPPMPGAGSLTSSPLTTALLLMVFGYYLCYESGLLLWTRRNPPTRL